MEKERTKALVIVVMLIVVAGLTVAFASLSSVLNIKGTAYLDAAKWGIKFQNLSEPEKIGTASSTGTAKIEEAKSAEINGINVSLSTPGDKVVYTVDLVNEGTINAKIDNIEKTVLTSEQQKYLTFKVTDKSGNEVSEGDILSKGETRNLTITIEFIKDLTKEDLPTNTSTISLSYKLNFVQTDEKKDTTTSSEVQNELPSGYKRVEYLESTGTQSIDTGISARNLNLGFGSKYVMNSTQIREYPRLFGAQDMVTLIAFGSRYWYGDSTTYKTIILKEKWDDMIHTLKSNNKGVYIDNDFFELENIPTIAPDISTPNILLFNGSLYSDDQHSCAKIYYFIIYDNNKLVRNFMPCLDSDNKPCMYDTVSKKTFYNNGTGEFLYGDVIN